MKQLYELRKRDRPPVTGAEALEVSKAAARMPRERFNELMEQLLDEIQRTGREIKKARRLMVIGNDMHNTNQVAALESLDAVVVMDEMNIGIRYAWGQVDTELPPMEALARYYVMGRPVDMHNWNSDGRLEFIGDMAEQYKVDGIISEEVRFCTYNGWDKFDLKKQMAERGIPILELDLEYGHPAGAQVTDPRRGVHGDAGKPGRLARRPQKGEQSMAVVGIDLGSQNTKAVILEGDEILGGASL